MNSNLSPSIPQTADQRLPLAVDLDGTLIKTDILWESFLALLKQNFFYLFLAPLWLVKGKACLKHEIARRVTVDIASLPYNQKFLTFLYGERERGRNLVMTTACDQTVAQSIAEHLGIFSEVFASDGKRNMKGASKVKALQEKFGDKQFIYAGNEHADLKVWAHSAAAILVNAPDCVIRKARRLARVLIVINDKADRLKALTRVIRPKHWMKNVLIFVPLITSRGLEQFDLDLRAVYAFISFSLIASAVYVFNDLADLSDDRQHPEKRKRPFASGELPLEAGLLIIPALLVTAISFSLFLPFEFRLLLIAYLVLNVAYSLWLKRVVLLDVILLAIFYGLRVLAGAMAISVPPSNWLLTFAVFMFLSLAFAKRVSELLRHGSDVPQAPGRGYLREDLERLAAFGIASGYIAVLVFTLYLTSPAAKKLYSTSEALWTVCPIILYWITRLWLLVHRGQMPDDPIIFVSKDKVSYFVGFAVAIALIVAG